MITVNIAYEVPAQTVQKIESYLDDLSARDIKWGGTEFRVERDDFTCISEDSIDATELLRAINDIISGHGEAAAELAKQAEIKAEEEERRFHNQPQPKVAGKQSAGIAVRGIFQDSYSQYYVDRFE